jgi:hypothetical protein
MILDAYYKLQKGNGKTRYDVIASTCNYEAFESLRHNSQLWFYLCDVPDRFKADIKRKADKCLTSRAGRNISSVFVPDISLPYAYGDVNGTTDAILILFSPDQSEMEIFIAKGKRNNRTALFHLLTDGELKAEIEVLRQAGKPVSKC